MNISILTIHFKNELKPFDVQHFRGAVINSLTKKYILFHNHLNNSLRYGYPLIQYKSIGNKAAIVCIGDGTEEIWHLFEDANFNMRIGQRSVQMAVDIIKQDSFSVNITDDKAYVYRITHWLPLNEDNYKVYTQTDSITSRITLLEKLLTGNILSMLKGFGIHADSKITTCILDISPPCPTFYKKVRLMMFDATFRTNVIIPDYIGLGRHTSVGYGIINQLKKQ